MGADILSARLGNYSEGRSKTQKTPHRAIELALERAEEVQ